MADEGDAGFGQRSRLVGAQDIHCSKVVNGREALHHNLPGRHADGSPRQGHGHDHGQEFRRETDRERHREEKRFESGPMEHQVDEEHGQNQERRHAKNQGSEFVQAALEGRGRFLRAQGRRDPAETGPRPGGDHEHGGLAAHQRRSAEQGIEGLCRCRGLARTRPLLDRERLAGQQRLVRVGRLAVEHDPVGRNEIARPHRHDVAGNDVLDRQIDQVAVAPHPRANRHRALEGLGRGFGAMLLGDIEGDGDAQNRENDAEARPVPRGPGDQRCRDQDDDQRFDEPFADLGEEPAARRLDGSIAANFSQPPGCFCTGQSSIFGPEANEALLRGKGPEVVFCHGLHRYALSLAMALHGSDAGSLISDKFRRSFPFRLPVPILVGR